MNPFPSLRSYEDFIYALSNRFDLIIASTLVVVRRGAKEAVIAGEVRFQNAYRLTISELVDFADGQFLIRRYGYEAWRSQEKLYWYDSQPHPTNPDLGQSNH